MSVPVPPGSRSAVLRPLMKLHWATSALFLLLLLLFFVVQNVIPDTHNFFKLAILPTVALLALLGILLVFAAARAPVTKWFKRALVITGISAFGIPLSAVLHNVVYGLAIRVFGQDFWGDPGPGGGDEPVFFFLALIVFPLLLIAGAIAGMVIYRRSGEQVLLHD